MIDAKVIEEEVKEELNKETKEEAKKGLKELYIRREKALLAVKNIDRQIENFIAQINEIATYESAGVDTTKA